MQQSHKFARHFQRNNIFELIQNSFKGSIKAMISLHSKIASGQCQLLLTNVYS